jgi:hypothetical protein
MTIRRLGIVFIRPNKLPRLVKTALFPGVYLDSGEDEQ